VTTLAAVAAIVSGAASATAAAAPALFLHMFASSSGFALPARRGHFDLILTRGASRRRVAVFHWCLSISPGLCCWLLLAVMEGSVYGSSSLRSPGALKAVALASTLPWAFNTRVARQSGAVAWAVAASMAEGLRGLSPVVLGLLAPWRLDAPIWSSGGAVVGWVPVVIAAAGALGAAIIAIDRMDVPLESGQ